MTQTITTDLGQILDQISSILGVVKSGLNGDCCGMTGISFESHLNFKVGFKPKEIPNLQLDK